MWHVILIFIWDFEYIFYPWRDDIYVVRSVISVFVLSCAAGSDSRAEPY